VDTDDAGYNDMVWLTTLVQVIRLNLNESPFFAKFGIPAHSSVVSQLAPDYYMNYIQQQFAGFFLFLSITNVPGTVDERNVPSPGYKVTCITQYGAYLSDTIPY
jgi:hypothetical protein